MSPSAKTFTESALPSPSVSSRILIRSAPFGPRGGGSGTLSYSVRRYWSTVTGLSPAGLGYCKYSTTHRRPRSSKQAVTGWRTIGSAAKISTWKPLGTTIRRTASSGVNPPGGSGGPSRASKMPGLSSTNKKSRNALAC